MAEIFILLVGISVSAYIIIYGLTRTEANFNGYALNTDTKPDTKKDL